MGGLEKYYDKDVLMQSIRFNAQFLDLSNEIQNSEQWQLCQYAELYQLLSEWKVRHYEQNDVIVWADEVLNRYHLIISQ